MGKKVPISILYHSENHYNNIYRHETDVVIGSFLLSYKHQRKTIYANSKLALRIPFFNTNDRNQNFNFIVTII